MAVHPGTTYLTWLPPRPFSARSTEDRVVPRDEAAGNMADELGTGSPANHGTTSVCSTCLRKIKLSTVPADGLVLKCDACNTVLSAGAKIWSCATCDHDVCQKCKPQADSLDLRRGTPDPMEDGEEDEGEEDTPEARAAKARRVAAAVDRQHRLLAGTDGFIGDSRRRRRGDGDEGAGEEGGYDEPDEAANRLAGVLSQGIMVCDSMHMVPPNVLLPPPPQELQDWQRRRRLGLVDVPAPSFVVEGGGSVPLLEPATPGQSGGATSLTTPGVAPVEVESAEVLGYPLVVMRRLVEQVYTWVHRHHTGHVDWTAVAAAMRPRLQPEEAHRLWRLVAYRLATPNGYEDGFYAFDPGAGEPVGTGHPHTKRKRAGLPESLAQVELDYGSDLDEHRSRC